MSVDYRIFLAGTSFVHYLRYINTYYHRVGCAYNIFKRDVLIYKTLAVSQVRATEMPTIIDPVALG